MIMSGLLLLLLLSLNSHLRNRRISSFLFWLFRNPMMVHKMTNLKKKKKSKTGSIFPSLTLENKRHSNCCYCRTLSVSCYNYSSATVHLPALCFELSSHFSLQTFSRSDYLERALSSPARQPVAYLFDFKRVQMSKLVVFLNMHACMQAKAHSLSLKYYAQIIM